MTCCSLLATLTSATYLVTLPDLLSFLLHTQLLVLHAETVQKPSKHGCVHCRAKPARLIATPPSTRMAAGYRELKRADQAILTQLRTDHIALNAYLHRFGRVNSPRCLCCGEFETVTHFLLQCTRFSDLLSTLCGRLQGQVMSVRTLLGVPENPSALMEFVHGL